MSELFRPAFDSGASVKLARIASPGCGETKAPLCVRPEQPPRHGDGNIIKVIIVDDSRAYTVRLKALLLKATCSPLGASETRRIKLRLTSVSSPKIAYDMMCCQQFSLGYY